MGGNTFQKWMPTLAGFAVLLSIILSDAKCPEITYVLITFQDASCLQFQKNIDFDTLTYWCKKYGQFSLSSGMTCCQGKLFNDTFNASKYDVDGNHDGCWEIMKAVDEDDYATSMYRRYLCLLKKDGATEEHISNFQNYAKYLTKNLEETMTSAILQDGEKCADGVTEKDELKRLAGIHSCFIQAQSRVCKNSTSKPVPSMSYNAADYCKKRSKDNTCCRGEGLPQLSPFPFELIFSSELSDTLNCREAFQKRLKELSQNLSTSLPTDGISQGSKSKNSYEIDPFESRVACRVHGDYFECYMDYVSASKSKGDLDIDVDELKGKIFAEFSKSTRQEIFSIFDRHTTEKYFLLPDKSNVTLKDAVNWMNTLDELSHIKVYLKIMDTLFLYLFYESRAQYCMGNSNNGTAGYYPFPTQFPL